MKFTIDRARWYRGLGGDGSRLYRTQDSKMCCLGFYLRSCGMKVKDLRHVTRPSSFTENEMPEEANWLCAGVGEGEENLVHLNDDLHIKERERRIKDTFAAHGIKVKFVG